MIRDATPADIPTMLRLGEAMHGESPRFRSLRWDAGKVERLIASLIDSEDGLALVAVRRGEIIGGFIGMAYDHWCTDARASTDLALFVHPDHRGGVTAALLVRRYAAWAKGRGVADELLSCGVTTGVNLPGTTRMLEVCGFEHDGHLFTYRGD